ncbi:MAG: AAA family ATPase [Gammaproteobacteria bacterium]|nr:MAG: AAA family ATPase [Gammaproteobacteria bacterium]
MSASSPASAEQQRKQLQQALTQLESIILGKPRQLRLALACLLARGHLLIEDLPGMGKTTLAHALAKVLGLSWQRVQFTSDMLPADVLGVSVFDPSKQVFHFHAGPVFTQLLLADEINRASPKTQSALLEAMAERQVTAEGETRPLPDPFFVIATQNPVTQYGTFPLPESQLDRFLMRVAIGYPDPADERIMLEGKNPRDRLTGVKPVCSGEDVLAMQAAVDHVHASNSLLDYVQRLIAHTRNTPAYALGLSPRGALALLAAARAWAWVDGRQHVVPEDVQAVFACVVTHRIQPTLESGMNAPALVRRTLDEVPVVA